MERQVSCQMPGEVLYLCKAVRAHHGDVGVGDGQNEGGAIGSGCHDAKGLVIALEAGQGARGDQRVGGQEGRQVCLHPAPTCISAELHAFLGACLIWLHLPPGMLADVIQHVIQCHGRPLQARRDTTQCDKLQQLPTGVTSEVRQQ